MDLTYGMSTQGFLTVPEKQELLALVRRQSEAHGVALRANALLLLQLDVRETQENLQMTLDEITARHAKDDGENPKDAATLERRQSLDSRAPGAQSDRCQKPAEGEAPSGTMPDSKADPGGAAQASAGQGSGKGGK